VDHDYAIVADTSRQVLASCGRGASGRRQLRRALRPHALLLERPAGPDQPPPAADQSLVDAYKTGFVYTQIIRDGNRLYTGANGYTRSTATTSSESWPTCSRRATSRTPTPSSTGPTSDRHADAIRRRLWTYSWPWAIYLEKTGDLSFVKAHFATGRPARLEGTEYRDHRHLIAADRTGPGGIMEETNDIDANGYWTIDNYEALMGLAAYRYLAQRVGDTSETTWATNEYNSLLAATNKTLDATIKTYGLHYLPCSMVEPNTDNRCVNAEDANWAAPFLFGRWAWDGYLFDAPLSGPGLTLIDATYDYGFGRLAGKLPPTPSALLTRLLVHDL